MCCSWFWSSCSPLGFGYHVLCSLSKSLSHHAIWLQGVGLCVSSVFLLLSLSLKTILLAFLYDLTCLSQLSLNSRSTSDWKVSDLKRISSCTLCATCFWLAHMTMNAVIYVPSILCALAYTSILHTKPCFASHSWYISMPYLCGFHVIWAQKICLKMHKWPHQLCGFLSGMHTFQNLEVKEFKIVFWSLGMWV